MILAYKENGKVVLVSEVLDHATGEVVLPLSQIAKIDHIAEGNPIIVEDAEIPYSEFHDAFDIVGGKVVVDIEKAKEIRKEVLESLKSRLVQELAQDYTKALVLGGDAGAIQRRALAVSTATFPIAEMPNDLEELKSYTPEGIQ